MEQSAGLLMITMLINQTIRSRSRYRKKGGRLNTNGPNMLAIVTADFLKGGPEFLPVFDANAIKIDTSTQQNRHVNKIPCLNIPCHYLVPESHGTSLSKDVPGCFVLFFQAYLFSLPIPLSKTMFCSPSLYEYIYYEAHSCSWIVNKTLAVKSRYFILHATTICNLGRLFMRYFTNSFMRTATCSFWHYADDDIMRADIKKKSI